MAFEMTMRITKVEALRPDPWVQVTLTHGMSECTFPVDQAADVRVGDEYEVTISGKVYGD